MQRAIRRGCFIAGIHRSRVGKRSAWVSRWRVFGKIPLSLTSPTVGRGDFKPPSLGWEGLGEGATKQPPAQDGAGGPFCLEVDNVNRNSAAYFRS
jgi:hypothetical protein